MGYRSKIKKSVKSIFKFFKNRLTKNNLDKEKCIQQETRCIHEEINLRQG